MFFLTALSIPTSPLLGFWLYKRNRILHPSPSELFGYWLSNLQILLSMLPQQISSCWKRDSPPCESVSVYAYVVISWNMRNDRQDYCTKKSPQLQCLAIRQQPLLMFRQTLAVSLFQSHFTGALGRQWGTFETPQSATVKVKLRILPLDKLSDV